MNVTISDFNFYSQVGMNYTSTASLMSTDLVSTSVQEITEKVSAIFHCIDRFLTPSLPIASAEPIVVTVVSGTGEYRGGAYPSTAGHYEYKVEKGSAFEEGAAGFEKMLKRVEITTAATKSLVELCQNDAEKCSLDTSERQQTTEAFIRQLEQSLPKSSLDKDTMIADCYSSEQCNPIGCKTSEELAKLPRMETVCENVWDDNPQHVGRCVVATLISPYFGIPMCAIEAYTAYNGKVECKEEEEDSFKYCKVHPREKKAGEVIHSRSSYANWAKSFFVPPEWKDYYEFLRFRADDPREKALFVAAESDHNGALSPTFKSSILVQLSQKYDIKYQVVKTVNEIHESIDSAAKTGKLVVVIIDGHANPVQLCLSNCNDDENENFNFETDHIYRYRSDFDSIFNGVQPNGKIFLIACSAGADTYVVTDPETEIETTYSFVDQNGKHMHLAQKMADGAKRTVIAGNDLVYPTRTSFLSSDLSMLYHPSKSSSSLIPFYNTNIFNTFKPEFKNCSSINTNQPHEKELLANKVIKDTLETHSLLTDKEKKSETDYLQICADDPRKKLLYFAAEYNEPQTVDPNREKEFLSLLADKFDLNYSVVKSKDDICEKVDKAAAFGEIAGVVLSATGSAANGLHLSEEAYLKANDDYTKCFEKLKKDAVIVLFGGSVGQNGEDPNNLAQKIANDAKRTVLAPTCPIDSKKAVVQSIDPLIVHHPQRGFFGHFFSWCSENNPNLFKTFEPKQKV